MADKKHDSQSDSTFPAFLQELACKDVPIDLWKVQHDKVKAKLAENGDIVAKDAESIPGSTFQLSRTVIGYLKRNHGMAPDCLIPVYGNYETALKWARDWTQQTEAKVGNVQLFKIDPRKLSETLVFRAVDLCKVLDVLGDSNNQNNHVFLDTDEYLVLSRIPAAAITLHNEGTEIVETNEFEELHANRSNSN